MRRTKFSPLAQASQTILCHRARLTLLVTFVLLGTFNVPAQLPDAIGLTTLRAATTNLNGDGVRVAQVESPVNGNGQPSAFEVNPDNASVNQPGSLFTYYSNAGTATGYPNSVGAESYHGNIVGGSFYGSSVDLATNVTHVDNYEMLHFVNNFVLTSTKPAIAAAIVNQSFILIGNTDTSLQVSFDQYFDDYAAKNGVLFVSGVGNADTNFYYGAVNSPASCYNGIGVAVYGTVYSSVGPTLDNGRSKPDITSPSVSPLATSFSTPLVSGSAAILMQAGSRGDGGSDVSSATDMRTLKALLLNGAIKPLDWTHSSTAPLDTRYGAGVLNVFNAYSQLAGGKHAWVEQTSVGAGNPHPPGSASGTIPAYSGWDFASISSSNPHNGGGTDGINHYYFDPADSAGRGPFTATATLVWNRQQGQSGINDLNLFLYDVATGNLISESISSVDNVEHLHIPSLPPGRYDLQVLKRGGSGTQFVNATESYALAWTFYHTTVDVATGASSAVLTWPIYPDGFVLEKATSLTPPVGWTKEATTPIVSSGLNRVQVSIGSNNVFFRLRPRSP